MIMLSSPYYTIRPKYWFVNDKPRDNLLFHIEKDDYFGTLATVLSLAREELAGKKISEWQTAMLEKETGNLMYLQKKYKIVPKHD